MAGWIADPDTYVDGPPHARFDEARRLEPVQWVKMDGEAGYWAVLRYADVIHVARTTDVYSAALGGVVVEDLDPVSLENMRGMLLAMDPPRHTAHRHVVGPHFRAGVMGRMEEQIRAITKEILDEAHAAGPALEFVHDVCAHVPSRVLGQLMGLPAADLPKIHALAERSSGG